MVGSANYWKSAAGEHEYKTGRNRGEERRLPFSRGRPFFPDHAHTRHLYYLRAENRLRVLAVNGGWWNCLFWERMIFFCSCNFCLLVDSACKSDEIGVLKCPEVEQSTVTPTTPTENVKTIKVPDIDSRVFSEVEVEKGDILITL